MSDDFPDMPSKRCAGECGEMKKIMHFNRDRASKDGRCAVCCVCHRESRRRRVIVAPCDPGYSIREQMHSDARTCRALGRER